MSTSLHVVQRDGEARCAGEWITMTDRSPYQHIDDCGRPGIFVECPPCGQRLFCGAG
jgi:hypothetical protein